MGKNWIKLHRLVYVLTIFAIVHNYMMVKADVLIPIIHATILTVLLGYRVFSYKSKKSKRSYKPERPKASSDRYRASWLRDQTAQR